MITILIPFFDQNQFRRRNLIEAIHSFRKNYPDFPILIAEQNANGFCDTLIDDKVNHVNIKIKSQYFNKSMIINIAIRENINGSLIMMADADCILPSLPFEFFEQGLKNASVFFPFSEVNFLNEAHTRSFIRTGTFKQAVMKQDLFINRYTGLINVFSRETFEAVGGFDPEFINWGGEDDAFIEKCKRLVGPINRTCDDITIFHLYHPKVNSVEYNKSECFTWNKKRVATIRRMTDNELIQYVVDLKENKESPLNKIVHKYDEKGLLTFHAKLPIGNGSIDIDTTVYNIIAKDGKIDLKEILECIYNTDGKGFLSYIIDLIDERIKNLSNDETNILNYFRSLI